VIYRSLGKCGTKVSAFGLGGWTTFGGSVTDAKATRSILRAAFEAGVNFFDIADVYAKGEAETAMGKALKEFSRHRLVVSTKVFGQMSDDVNDRGLSRKHILESIDRSLQRIGTDYVDIYFCHRFDPETPVEETARAMDDLIHRGKVLYWGTSEWSGEQLRSVHELCRKEGLYPPQVEQPQYSLLVRGRFESEIAPATDKLGMGNVVWSPLASGLLTGKYDKGMPKGSRLAELDYVRQWVYTEESIDKVRRFAESAKNAGCSRAQLALAWAVSRPGVSSVILGATRLEQLKENLGALDVKPDPSVLKELDRLFPASAG
jgi:voltage-dependent potassium channel beta subunit